MASRLRQELLDPWGGVIAGIAGGLAWAVVPLGAVALPVGLGVAAVVYGVKVGAGMLSRSADETAGRRARARAAAAAARLDRRAVADPGPGRRPRAGRAGPLARVADREGAARPGPGRRGRGDDHDDAAWPARSRPWRTRPTGSSRAGCAAERDRLAAGLAAATTERVRAERQRSLDSVDEQLQVAARLAGARDELLARMQATALTLEGLVARTAEVLAMSVSGGVDLSADRLSRSWPATSTGCAPGWPRPRPSPAGYSIG